jgi:hypothetical protein
VDPQDAKQQLANALDVPVKFLQGTPGVNHWTDHQPIRTCGAWPQLGGCVLPAAHNQGNADLPDAHQFPAGHPYAPVFLPVRDGETKHSGLGDQEPRHCRLCDRDIEAGPTGWLTLEGPPADKVIVSASMGTVHAECYLAEVQTMSTKDAWVVIAQEIAKRPSKHTAAEIRAALTALTRIIKEK